MAPLSPYETLEKVRAQQPLVHHITNWVTISDCAQVVKSIGASPVMAHAPEEIADMTQLASAVVLNIGTLTLQTVAAMKLAAHHANRRVIPVVLDACGAGATRFRDEQAAEILKVAAIDIIKGNGSEIASLAGERVRTRGVDSTETGADLLLLAQTLARKQHATVVVTGKIDIVTDGARTLLVKNGHPLMAQVVGTGCMAASVIGAFAAVDSDLAAAAAAALACFGIAGELAAESATGPADFKNKLFDCLYRLDRDAVTNRQKIGGP